MRLDFYDGLNHTPAIGIALKAWADMHANGLSENIVLLHWEQKTFVASETDGKPIGVIVFEHNPGLKSLFVFIGWVDPDYRKRGIYRALWAALVGKAQELKAVKIGGVTKTDNDAMRATAKAFGRREFGISLDFDVPAQ